MPKVTKAELQEQLDAARVLLDAAHQHAAEKQQDAASAFAEANAAIERANRAEDENRWLRALVERLTAVTTDPEER